MSLVICRSTFARLGGMNCWLGQQIHPLNTARQAAVAKIQVAGLKATYGEKYPYKKPWKNWETRKYTLLHEFFDATMPRLNENSKVIVVDGNVSVGKNEFAKRLAEGFDLKLIESVPDSACFTSDGYDYRELNRLLPESAQFYDLQKFLADPNPQHGKVGRLQLQWFVEKFLTYARGLHHLMSTGQGFVMVRSPFSDDAFVEALRRVGYVTPSFVSYYYDIRDNGLCELLKPHISVYLDAPLTTIQKRIQERADPREVGSQVLTDKYLTALDTVYKKKVLPRMRETGHVIEVDWTEPADDLEMEVIIEEVQRLELDPEDNEDTRFQDWAHHNEDQYCHFRKYFGSKRQMSQLVCRRRYPYECPEICHSDEDIDILGKVFYNHPLLTDKLGESHRLGQRNLWGFF